MAAALNNLGAVVRQGSLRGSYTDAERELADVVLSVDFDYRGVLPIHLPDAIAVGVRPDAIDAIREGREGDLADDERQLVDYIRQVSRGQVTDESFGAMVERFGLSGAVDYTAFVAFLICTMRLWSALGVRDPSNHGDRRAARGPARGPRQGPGPGGPSALSGRGDVPECRQQVSLLISACLA